MPSARRARPVARPRRASVCRPVHPRRAPVPSRAPCAPSSTGNAPQPCAVPSRRPDPRASRRRYRSAGSTGKPSASKRVNLCGLCRRRFRPHAVRGLWRVRLSACRHVQSITNGARGKFHCTNPKGVNQQTDNLLKALILLVFSLVGGKSVVNIPRETPFSAISRQAAKRYFLACASVRRPVHPRRARPCRPRRAKRRRCRMVAPPRPPDRRASRPPVSARTSAPSRSPRRAPVRRPVHPRRARPRRPRRANDR